MTTHTRLHQRGRRALGLLAAVTMTGVLATGLAACSSSGSDDATSEGSDSGGMAASSPSSEVAPNDIAPEMGDQSKAGDYAEDSAGNPASNPAARPPAIERAVISNGTVSLVADDVAVARREVQRIVDSKRGTISEESTETDDDGVATYSRLVIRVPAGSFSDTMQELEKAAELRSSQVSSEDVTTQVIDTDVRVRAQEGSLRRVEQLLARAESLKDIIWIESQLTTRQAELDSLKSQQAWLSDQTSDSTITIDIERTRVEKKDKSDKDDDGFLAGLTTGMKGLGAFTTALATIVGAMLPFVIVAGILGFPVWLLVRRSARRRPSKQPATSTT